MTEFSDIKEAPYDQYTLSSGKVNLGNKDTKEFEQVTGMAMLFKVMFPFSPILSTTTKYLSLEGLPHYHYPHSPYFCEVDSQLATRNTGKYTQGRSATV